MYINTLTRTKGETALYIQKRKNKTQLKRIRKLDKEEVGLSK